MTDRFLTKVAELSGLTARQCTEAAEICDECGLTAMAHQLRQLAKLHTEIVVDCYADTPLPARLPTDKYPVGK